MKHVFSPKGFTFVELAITMGVFAILISVAALNFINISRHTSVISAASQLVSDLREQQTKAMVGDSEGRGISDHYGIYFGASSYTLFHGLSYTSSDPANYVVNLEQNLQFATPGGTLVFLKVSGNVATYSAVTNTVIVKDTQSQEQQTIQYNRYGVITQVQ